MTDNERYIQAAIAQWGGDPDVDITSVITPADDGAWVHALLFVRDDELEPKPGPTYVIWCCYLNNEGTAFGRWLSDSGWTCDDDPDGKKARANAHDYARSLRRQYPASLVAVRPAGSRPLTPHFNR